MTLNGENYLTSVYVEFEFEEEIDDETLLKLEENIKSEFKNFEKNIFEVNLENESIIMYKNEDISKIDFLNDFITISYNGKNFKDSKDIIRDTNLMISALRKTSIKKLDKVTIRFINEITARKPIPDWESMINPKLINYDFEPKNSKIRRSLTQSEYEIGEYEMIFKYGEYNLNYPSTILRNDFILDYDCNIRFPEIYDLYDDIQIMLNIIYEFYQDSVNGG